MAGEGVRASSEWVEHHRMTKSLDRCTESGTLLAYSAGSGAPCAGNFRNVKGCAWYPR